MQARQTKVLICLPYSRERGRIPRSPHFRPVACIMQGDRGAPAKTYDDTMKGKLYTNTARKNFGYGETLPIFELALSYSCVTSEDGKKEKRHERDPVQTPPYGCIIDSERSVRSEQRKGD